MGKPAFEYSCPECGNRYLVESYHGHGLYCECGELMKDAKLVTHFTPPATNNPTLDLPTAPPGGQNPR